MFTCGHFWRNIQFSFDGMVCQIRSLFFYFLSIANMLQPLTESTARRMEVLKTHSSCHIGVEAFCICSIDVHSQSEGTYIPFPFVISIFSIGELIKHKYMLDVQLLLDRQSFSTDSGLSFLFHTSMACQNGYLI